jgi:hypothetical protein
MGEKIKDLAQCNINNMEFDIELNEPVVGNRKLIHIQTDKLRYEMNLSEYLRIAFGICLSAEHLKVSKKLYD